MQKAFKKGGMIYFICPGCKDVHGISVEPTNQNPNPWGWNGSLETPTFTPSILVTRHANPDAGPGFEEYLTERRCHSFVTDGKIQFLSDSAHSLAGQTVDLPEWDHRWD